MSDSPDLAAWRRLAAVAGRAGLDVYGAIPIASYDARVAPPWRSQRLLPGARAAAVLGSGGRALWSAFERSPEFVLGRDPLDAYCERIAAEAAAALGDRDPPAVALLAHQQREGTFADLVALGEAAGLGARSRLGLLVHPEYGPWMSLRAVVLTSRHLPDTAPSPGFDPCAGCPAPCASACHGAALAPGGFDAGRCAATRAREPACLARCDARHACVLGRGHAYPAAAEAHHMRRAGARPDPPAAGPAPSPGG